MTTQAQLARIERFSEAVQTAWLLERIGDGDGAAEAWESADVLRADLMEEGIDPDFEITLDLAAIAAPPALSFFEEAA